MKWPENVRYTPPAPARRQMIRRKWGGFPPHFLNNIVLFLSYISLKFYAVNVQLLFTPGLCTALHGHRPTAGKDIPILTLHVPTAGKGIPVPPLRSCPGKWKTPYTDSLPPSYNSVHPLPSPSCLWKSVPGSCDAASS